MSVTVDETAGDLPVRDVGLRGGAMTVTQGSEHDIRPWKKHTQVLKLKDRQRVFRIPREQLEDQCLHLQEENTLLKQHTRTQEQKLRRLSTKLLKLRYGRSNSAAGRDADAEDMIQELEARVATLESQKEVLQNKLSVAKQQILGLGRRAFHRPHSGRGVEGDGGIRRAAQTAPARYAESSLEDTRGEIERLSSVIETQQMRVTELEMSAQTLKETLKEKEREIEDTMKELRRQQADENRYTIKDNVDVIRLQKQLSEKSTALLVIQEKFSVLKEAYETQLEKGQKSLCESQEALLGKVEEMCEQLKEEKQRVLTLEEQLNTATLSLKGLEELQQRASDLEEERNLLKKSYDSLLESTLSAQSHQVEHEDKERERERLKEEKWKIEVKRLQEMLEDERREKEKLELEKDRMREEHERIHGEREREKSISTSLREKHNYLEQEVLRHRQEATSLQERLDRVTKEFDMSVEDLSETLIQIKTFRMQQESHEGLRFLGAFGKAEDSSRELVALQASHAETVLELQKTRDLLLMQQRLNHDLQAEMKTETARAEGEREESKRRVTEKDKLLKSRALQINNLQAQLKHLAYSPRNYDRTIPQQYTWTGMDQELVQPMEDETMFTHLREGDSLLEFHVIGAIFTPVGLRRMRKKLGVAEGGIHDVVTFCTYAFLDFEMHSTPLVLGTQPNYGFTSCYALAAQDLTKLEGQGASLHVELHQALGGVQFMTQGMARIPIMGALQHRGKRVKGGANVKGSEGEIIGVLDFWIRLNPQVDPAHKHHTDSVTDNMTDRLFTHKTLNWSHVQSETQELFDYGGGIPNELVVVLERCVGLSGRWPGLLPDAYLTYRLYDLPPHSTPTIQCCADPHFADTTTYPLAVTADLMEYLKVGSLWVYVFDDSEGQTPPTYLAKTPIPLHALSKGRPIRGDYVLRDPVGVPRGMVRVHLQWKYPFHSPEALSKPAEKERQGSQRKLEDRLEVLERPIAKPRKLVPQQHEKDQPQPRPPPITIHKSQRLSHSQSPAVKSASPLRAPGQGSTKPLQTSARPQIVWTRPTEQSQATPSRSLYTDQLITKIQSPGTRICQEVSTVEQHKEEEEEGVQSGGSKIQGDSDVLESEESATSSDSDIIIIPTQPKPVKKGDRLRVEIFSLSFDPSSSVALDQSVQQVYVEYRLFGVPMETTETPMSLRKPTAGEDIHYNFTRVIHVDTIEAAPLRHYLYTMLEGTDPNQGRLKFTVVSEPLNEEHKCEDVGQAYLDLQELLLTGNDVIERQIDIISMDDDRKVGKLRVSVEAAQALSGIYWEFHDKKDMEKVEAETEDREEEEEEEEEERKEESQKVKVMQVTDFDDDDF